MYKALAFKEWLKIKRAVYAAAVLEVVVLSYIFINLRAIIEFNSAVNIWNYLITRNFMFFDSLKFLPVFIGILIAVAQYLPEMIDSKLKLTLHLPLREENIFTFLNFFGTVLLILLYLPVFLLLLWGSSLVFPAEIISAIALSIFPWFVAGIAAYYFASLSILEPIWGKRLVIIIVGFVLTKIFFYDAGYGAYSKVNVILFIFTLLLFPLIQLPGFRFKRGVQ